MFGPALFVSVQPNPIPVCRMCFVDISQQHGVSFDMLALIVAAAAQASHGGLSALRSCIVRAQSNPIPIPIMRKFEIQGLPAFFAALQF